MSSFSITTLTLLILLSCIDASSKQELKVVEMAHSEMLHAIQLTRGLNEPSNLGQNSSSFDIAMGDCLKLYEDSEQRLVSILDGENLGDEDVVTLLSAAFAGHTSCLEALSFDSQVSQNLTLLLKEALALYGHKRHKGPIINKGIGKGPTPSQARGLLASWSSSVSKADIVVPQDGSENYRTIKEAVLALAKKGHNRPDRLVIYVREGIYREKVEIGRELKNVMFVGDGIDRTIVTGNQNVVDGSSTLSSATFGVSGDGFWERDMTFENTAGPHKHQAVPLRVGSDMSVFYRCSFKGYQDTLLVHSLRQFYRACHIYGTVDFIFGDAIAVFQNCDIFVRRPMDHQSNIVTAQGRNNPNENTGFSIMNCRIAPSPDFSYVKSKFDNYLGRPWKRYSRTVFLKTDLDSMVHPSGWKEWRGNFALSTLFYGEFMNTGYGVFLIAKIVSLFFPGYGSSKMLERIKIQFWLSTLFYG